MSNVRQATLIVFMLFVVYTLATMIFAMLTKQFNANIMLDFGLLLNAFSENEKMRDHVLISLIVSSIICLCLLMRLKKNKSTVHGDARLANEREIKAAGLREKEGILIGNLKGKFLQFGQPGHVLVTSPTGGGKGVGFVLPNLLNFEGSIICNDPKYENWNKTSRYRKEKLGNDVFLFSPLDPTRKTNCYNPLDYISDDRNVRPTDINIIAKILVESPKTGDPQWAESAQELFQGLVIYIMDNSELPTTLGQIARMLNGPDSFSGLLQSILDNETIDPIARMNFNSFIQKAPKEQSGVKSTLNASLTLFKSPLVDAATSKSDFDLRDIRRKKTTIYLGFKLSQDAILKPILKLLIEQLADTVLDHEPREDEIYTTWAILDEFPLLGRLEKIPKVVALARSYRLFVMAVIQSESQLASLYGKDTAKEMSDNFKVKVYTAPDSHETAEKLSKRSGTFTEKQLSSSKQGGLLDAKSSNSESRGWMSRALLQPLQINTMSIDHILIFMQNMRPIIADKIYVFKCKELKQRLYYYENTSSVELKQNPLIDLNDTLLFQSESYVRE